MIVVTMPTYWMPQPRPRVSLRCKGIRPVQVARLLDHELSLLRDRSVPVPKGLGFGLLSRMSQPPNTLPQSKVGAEQFFGPSSLCFDPYKGTFAFPLLLTFDGPAAAVRYAGWLRDFHGWVEVELFRVRDTADATPAADAGLGGWQLEYLTNYLVGFVTGAGQALGKAGVLDPFFVALESELLTYGYEDGQWFERNFDTLREYQAEVDGLEQRLGLAQRAADWTRLQALLASCAPPTHGGGVDGDPRSNA